MYRKNGILFFRFCFVSSSSCGAVRHSAVVSQKWSTKCWRKAARTLAAERAARRRIWRTRPRRCLSAPLEARPFAGLSTKGRADWPFERAPGERVPATCADPTGRTPPAARLRCRSRGSRVESDPRRPRPSPQFIPFNINRTRTTADGPVPHWH